MLGIAIGSMANQPKEENPPQVIIVEQPAGPEEDPALQEKLEELEMEIERERERARELEEELERLKAERNE